MLFFIESIAFFMGMIQQLTPTPLKGATATSPRQRLGGENWEQISALQGQKHKTGKGFCTYSASFSCTIPTQGDALGYEWVGLSGRSLSERANNYSIPKEKRPDALKKTGT